MSLFLQKIRRSPVIPSATEFDWVQLTSGEWLKGEVKSMYNENIEFDRDKLDLLTIDLEDINNRITAGVGIGCTIINTHNTEWSVSGAPSYFSTKYILVLPGEEVKVNSASISISTSYETEINNKIDFINKYNMQVSEKKAGG